MTKKKEKEFYSEVDQLLDAEEFLESVREGFCGVDDPRAKDNLSYPLVNLLIMTLCSVLAGANTIIDIYNYAHLKLNMFQRILNGGSAKLRRILVVIDQAKPKTT